MNLILLGKTNQTKTTKTKWKTTDTHLITTDTYLITTDTHLITTETHLIIKTKPTKKRLSDCVGSHVGGANLKLKYG